MLANYTELQDEINDTLHRADLTAKIPSFIALFEARANRSLNIPQMETTVDLTLPAGANYVDLPANLVEIEDAVVMVDGIPSSLQSVIGQIVDLTHQIASIPTQYTISGGQMLFDCLADATYTIKLRYLKRFDLAADTTNWLLTYHPDAYLYGSLAASAPYIQDDERLTLWINLAEAAISEIKRQGARLRQTPLITELNTSQTFDIVRGY